MKEIILSVFLVIAFASVSNAQQVLSPNPFGFVMDHPKGWFPINKDEIETSLKRLNLEQNKVDQYLSQNEGKLLLFAFVRNKQDSFNGINPKIEGRVLRINSPKPVTFGQFRPAAIATLRKIASQFAEQTYIVEPSDIKIGGVDSVFHVSEFSANLNNGNKYRVRSRTYLIPRGTYFFQISFVDEVGGDDCSEVFDSLLGSIRLS